MGVPKKLSEFMSLPEKGLMNITLKLPKLIFQLIVLSRVVTLIISLVSLKSNVPSLSMKPS